MNPPSSMMTRTKFKTIINNDQSRERLYGFHAHASRCYRHDSKFKIMCDVSTLCVLRYKYFTGAYIYIFKFHIPMTNSGLLKDLIQCSGLRMQVQMLSILTVRMT